MVPKSQSERRGILVDTDVGYDDVMALAMLVAAGQPLVGITTVHGLAHAERGARNVLSLLARMGCRDVPVAVGAEEPLAGDGAFESSWRHEADALPGIALPPTSREPLSTPASRFLVETVWNCAEPVTLLCLGPLTNLALAFAEGGLAFVEGIARIVVMGGAVRVAGNETPNQVSEWNFYVDPLAAVRTLRSGIPLTLVGLDATNLARREAAIEALRGCEPGHGAGHVMLESLRGMYDYLYDPVAAAYLLNPTLIRTERLSVSVVPEGPNCGQTIERPRGAAIEVALGLDVLGFYRLLRSLVV